MKTMHIPIRECICCGDKFPKDQLHRIVKNDSGIFLDASGKQKGRGAYLCNNPACLEKLTKHKRLNRSFRGSVKDSVYQEIEKELLSVKKTV